MALNREKRRLIERRKAKKEAERIYDFEEVALWDDSTQCEFENIHKLPDSILQQLEVGLAPDSDSLQQLFALGEVLEHLTTLRDDAARTARAEGRSWAQIAAPLGITRQAAQQRYWKQ